MFTTTPGIIEKQHEEAVVEVFTKGFKDDNISVCERLAVPFKLNFDLLLGTDFRYGSFRLVVPVDLQKVPAQILRPHARPSQHPSSPQGVL